jgi:hypothetical protein
MNQIWLYLGIGFFLVVAFVSHQMQKNTAREHTRDRIDSLISILGGVVFLCLYITKSADEYALILGVMCVISGTYALELSRIRIRLNRLEEGQGHE